MEVRVYENTSIEGIRQSLSGFGRFSRIEIDQEQNDPINGKCFIFREIGFFKGLHQRIFKRKEDLYHSIKNSQIHFYELSKKRPDIQKLLGSSILEKASWQVGEFREKLKIKTDFIRRDENDNLLHVPSVSHSKVGVIDARMSHIKADSFISWKVENLDKDTVAASHDLNTENKASKKIISLAHKKEPDTTQLRAAYKNALSDALGRVVISPIVDVSFDQIQTRQPEYASSSSIHGVCSDDSIRILLEEIDLAIQSNKNITSVTIARSGDPDEQFLPRVVGQRAILDNQRRADEDRSKNLPPMPDSLKLIQAELAERIMLTKAEALQDVTFKKTNLERVTTCFAAPEMLAADVAFLDVLSVARGAVTLKKSGLGELMRVWGLSFNKRFVSSQEVNAILQDTKTKWHIGAFELPSCELPATQVIAFERVIAAEGGGDKEKVFFMSHLQNLKGRVVIEIGEQSPMRDGLVAALEELSGRPQGLGFDCVLAYGNRQVERSLPKLLQEP